MYNEVLYVRIVGKLSLEVSIGCVALLNCHVFHLYDVFWFYEVLCEESSLGYLTVVICVWNISIRLLVRINLTVLLEVGELYLGLYNRTRIVIFEPVDQGFNLLLACKALLADSETF